MDFDTQELSTSMIEAYRGNFSASESDNEHFWRCWRHQNCDGCLSTSQCSWCPFTWSCVPNSDTIALLAPAYNEDICPHWAERWELRTQPLGCQVSTITSLTGLVAAVSGMIAVLLVFGVFALGACLRGVIRRRRRATRKRGTPFWGSWLGRKRASAERDPLLPGQEREAS